MRPLPQPRSRRLSCLALVASVALSAAVLPLGSAAAAKPPVRTTVSHQQVDEGQTVTVTTRIRAPRLAKRVRLERWVPRPLGGGSWQQAASTRVKGRATVRFRVVASTHNHERFRSRVSYRKAPARTSRPASVVVWRWVPLVHFAPVGATGHPSFGPVDVAGVRSDGWGATFTAGSVSAAFGLAGRCSTVRGGFGIDDESAAGASGYATARLDGRQTWTSPVVGTGQLVPFGLDVTGVQSLAFALTSSTPTVDTHPVLQDTTLRCTGL